ncbi:MAG: exosortase/archaeosortase family protein [Dehalococcoidales bacterium]|nr:exosortase/archaeosortase family protein [Dehalococcoidales bacterium]
MRKAYWIGAIVFMGLALSLLYLPTLRWLWDEWFRTAPRFYAHGSLVVLISGWLVWRKRRVFASAQPGLMGIPLVLVALTLGILALFQNLPLLYTYSLSAYSLLLLTIGVLLVVSGRKVTRQLMFPLLFLALAIPLPFTHQLGSFLANIVATGSVALAEATGLAIVRDGTLVVVGGYSYSIDPLCSSLNIMLALFTLVLPILYLKRYSGLKTVLFLLATPAVALVFKILLVTLIYWMTLHGEPEMALQAYHGWAGMLFFWFSLLAMVIPLLLLTRPKFHQTQVEATR